MYRPIIEGNNINFLNLYDFIFKTLKKYFKITLFLTFVSFIYFSIKTPAYSSSVSFYSNYVDTSSQGLSSLSFINNINTPENAHLGFSIDDYLNSDRFTNDILSKEYNVNGEKVTLVDLWGENYNKLFSINPISLLASINREINLNQNLSEEEKKYFFVKEKLVGSVVYFEDKISSLNTITVTVKKYPNLAKNITRNIFASVTNFSNEVTNTKAQEKRIFIEDRLSSVGIDLKDSEEKLLLFLEKNKSYGSSPALILEKNRLERSIMLYNQLYISLSDKLEITKIDEKDTTSSISILDKSNTLPYKAGRGVIQKTFIMLILFSILFICIGLVRDREKLFILNSNFHS